MDTGGRLVPDWVEDELIRQLKSEGPYRRMFPAPERKPLTWRQKLRVRWYDLKWGVHDRLFGHHENDGY